MKHISDEQILKQISDEVSQITPDKSDELWEKTVTPADGTEWYLDSSAPFRNKRKKKIYFIGAIAACCLLLLVSTLMFQVMPSASVYLDVNPSILLKVNYMDHVTDVTAQNEDAERVLEGLELKGTDLNVALYAILGSMVHHGYITQSEDTVLVSVHSANTKRANELEDTISNIIEDDLDDLIQSGDILTHSIDTDETDSECSPGKSAFIDDLLKKYPQLKDYPLKSMTMDEITSLLKKQHLDYSHYKNKIEYDDDDDIYDIDDDDDRDDIDTYDIEDIDDVDEYDIDEYDIDDADEYDMLD